MNTYSIQTASALLAINISTLHRWRHSAHMRLLRSPTDHRRHVIPGDQLVTLAKLHGRFIVEIPETQTIEQRLAHLEQQVAFLQARIETPN